MMGAPATFVDDLADLDYVLIAPRYPRGWRNGGEFIRTRVLAYRAAGLRGVVIDYSGPELARFEFDGVTIWSVALAGLADLVGEVVGRRIAVLAHSPDPTVIDLLVDTVDSSRMAVWFHGYELRDYRRLASNNTSRELSAIGGARRRLNQARFTAARRLFTDTEAAVVFVSEFQRDLAHFDVGAQTSHSHVIPNHIDTDLYRARVRRPDEATTLLLMRSFNVRNYGNDIALRALEHLAQRPGFHDLKITVRGFGTLFAAETARLRAYPNIRVEERYSSPVEMAAKHFDHGVFLCPTRFDTQGVMLGEAMASGMVTITNPVAAIPEFTDDDCSLLPRGDDPIAFAEAVSWLLEHPQQMPRMSTAAAERVRRQCGYDATIAREIELISERAA